jgi:hypothetical protein
MTTKDTPTIGTLGHNNRVYLQWLDTDTGERGQGWFGLDRLIELGYGKMRMCDLVVRVRTVRL